MQRMLNNVVVIDAVRTAFGRAGEKGIFWNTRAEELCVPLLKALIERNAPVTPAMVEDIIWGVTNQMKEQGGTIGRLISMLADWGWQVPGCSVDRMCASGLTAVNFGINYIATGMVDCLICGGVEHMGHIPMGFMRDPHPRLEEVMGDASAFNMGLTAENIHDRWPEFTREMADRYALVCQQKADQAIRAGKMKNMIIPIETTTSEGQRFVADSDQHPRPTTTLEGLQNLKTPFRETNGRITAGNASGLNDGAAAVLLMRESKARELGLQPKMRWVATGIAAVDPRVMGIGPVPATEKALQKAGLTMDDIDIIELNEAFAVELQNFNGIKTTDLDKLGSHSSPTGEIFFDNTRVPRENLLGQPGDGAAIVFASLNNTRISAAAGAVGCAQACLEIATRYCNDRRQFGKVIGHFQLNQDLIAQMSTEVDAARLLVYRAAWQKDQGRENNGLEVAQAKYFAGEVAVKCAGYAMRILGAYGYSTEYPVARYYRDVPTYVMVEGSANICKQIIAADQLGYRKANR